MYRQLKYDDRSCDLAESKYQAGLKRAVEQYIKQNVRQTVVNMLNEGISEDVIIRIFPQLSVDDIRFMK